MTLNNTMNTLMDNARSYFDVNSKLSLLDLTNLFTPSSNIMDGTKDFTGDWVSARYLFDDLTKRNVINTTDDFVFSAMLRVDPTLKDSPAFINFFSNETTKDNTTIGKIKDYADGEWHQVSAAFKFLTTPTKPPTPTDNTLYTQSLRFELGATNGAKVYWAQRKLEKGSVATPWTLAPEDVGVK